MSYKLYILALASAIIIFAGCRKDVFDSGTIERDYFIEDIPEGFSWATSLAINTEVIPSDKYDGTYWYTIEFFDRNPLIDSSAQLLGNGWCSSKQPLKKTIIIPDAQTTLFVEQITPGGRRSVMEVPIENNSAVCDFSQDNSPISKNRTISLLTNSDNFEIPSIPTNVKEILTQKDNLESGNNYIIRGEYTGELNFTNKKNISVYVTGTWNNTATSTKLEVNTNIYVVNNGKIFSPKEWNIQVYSSSNIAIAKGCQLGEKDHDKISLRLNSGNFINEGLTYMDEINTDQSNTSIKNSGELHLNKLKATNPITINNADGGKMYIDELEIGNAIFINQCYVEIEEMKLNYNSSLSIASGCAVKCEEMKADGAKITLASNSLLEVTDEAEFKGAVTTIGRTGNDFALFKTKKLQGNLWGWKILKCSGQLYVECGKIEVGNDFCEFTPPAQLVDSGKGSLIEIPASECSQGNDYQPEQPEQPEFPKQVTLKQSYTFASEDNYPSPGDYDMNDLVVSIDSITYNYMEKDMINRMIYHVSLRAVGASRQLGAAIQLDDIKASDIKSITYSKELPQDNFKTKVNGTEKDQKYAVIPLFDNAHKALGIATPTIITNTVSNDPKWINDVPINSFDITIEFTSLVEDVATSINKINYFAIVGTKTPRTEIHFPKYAHTDLSSAPTILQDATKDLMWTIQIPGIFRYPHEWISILETYTDFKIWVQSGGNDKKEWYSNPTEEKLYQKK